MFAHRYVHVALSHNSAPILRATIINRLQICDFLYTLSGALMYLNEATLLNNLRLRYKKNQIYVSIQ